MEFDLVHVMIKREFLIFFFQSCTCPIDPFSETLFGSSGQNPRKQPWILLFYLSPSPQPTYNSLAVLLTLLSKGIQNPTSFLKSYLPSLNSYHVFLNLLQWPTNSSACCRSCPHYQLFAQQPEGTFQKINQIISVI